MVSEKEDACWIEACKRKRWFLGDGKLRRKSASQNIILIPLNMPCGRKKRFLEDGIVGGRLTTPNGIGRVERISKRRKRWFLADGIVRRTPVSPNMILGQFKALQEKERIPDGWNSKREASNNQHGLGAIDKNDSWWMEQSEEGKQYPTWSWPYSKGSGDDSWWMA